MHKVISQLETKIGERIYRFQCDTDAPRGEVYDVLTQFRSYVFGIIKAAEENKEEISVEQEV